MVKMINHIYVHIIKITTFPVLLAMKSINNPNKFLFEEQIYSPNKREIKCT